MCNDNIESFRPLIFQSKHRLGGADEDLSLSVLDVVLET